ncbi:MAG TPA: hypothetical protein VK929_10910 [Longimicrobiales bacterium]|nr:hypothetical protein [Longimicrobiales bacterium]
MAGKLSPAAQGRLNDLALLQDKVQRVHGLVEQYATVRTNPDQYLLPMSRVFSQLKMNFMGAGLDAMSQLAGSMEIAAKRGLPPSSKTRILREGVGSLRFQLEMAQRAIISEDAATQQKKVAEAEQQARLERGSGG